MASFSFDATKVAPQDSFDPIPAGSYIAQVEESEVKPTKSGSGQRLNLKVRILDGNYKNRVIFNGLNIVHNDKTVEDIGQRQLSSLCHAVGVLQLTDTSQLHMKPMKIKVKIKEDKTGQWGDSNEITNYEGVQGASIAPVAAPAAPSAPAAPWARKAA